MKTTTKSNNKAFKNELHAICSTKKAQKLVERNKDETNE